MRMCIDYQKLSIVTIENKYLLPQVYDLFYQLQDTPIFQRFDPRSGYHHLNIRHDNVANTTFRTRYGHY